LALNLNIPSAKGQKNGEIGTFFKLPPPDFGHIPCLSGWLHPLNIVISEQ
jgi:hypothetical protein